MKRKRPKVRPVPRGVKDMRPVDRAFIYAVMFQLGVLPIEDPTYDMRRPTKDAIDPEKSPEAIEPGRLTVDETRKLRRRFRKLWRKYMREQITEVTKGASPDLAASRTTAVMKELGAGKQNASRHDKLRRKKLVYERIWEDCVVPMLERFENPGAKGDPGDGGDAR